MEFMMPLIVAFMVLAIIMAGVKLVCNRINDYCALTNMRKKLLARLSQTRLGKMLASLGIGAQDYLQRFTASSIEEHIDTCEHCGATGECDHFLAEATHSSQAAAVFCPNMKALDRLTEKH